ncbi:peptidylprolyl isomerase [Paracoccus sp. TK19116]|uniref:Parvulin-like PPIase n=1 Tax=Paracoccus albicereus TaxID=2922394 RepID=A0ABT1MSG4_9RHOB|nr:peptidylprolyl isomerase [Paracoccus albicereus]MCQ0971247.1 peptidylprolyl isomerase [Paracoccus albicereus]
MLKRFPLAACLMAGTALIVPALPAAAQDAGTVVATVDGTPITLGQMIAMKRGLHDQAAAELPDRALWDLMLDQMVRQTAVANVGENEIDAGDVAALEIERRAYLASAALERLASEEPTDEEVNAAYEAAFGEAAPQMQYSAAHILVDSEEKAKELKAELDGGADFATLAQENSSDSSAQNGGDLGWFSPEQMVQPFADAVVALDKGAVSEPVQSDFGWHIIKLNDSRQMEAPKLEEIRPQLIQQIRREKVDAEIQSLVTAASVDRVEGLDPSLLTRVELLDAPAGDAQPAAEDEAAASAEETAQPEGEAEAAPATDAEMAPAEGETEQDG